MLQLQCKLQLSPFCPDSDEDQTLRAVNPVTISGNDDDDANTLTTTITIPPKAPKRVPVAVTTSGHHVQNAVIQTGTTTIVLPVITTSRNGKQVGWFHSLE